MSANTMSDSNQMAPKTSGDNRQSSSGIHTSPNSAQLSDNLSQTLSQSQSKWIKARKECYQNTYESMAFDSTETSATRLNSTFITRQRNGLTTEISISSLNVTNQLSFKDFQLLLIICLCVCN
eukprot:362579_1